MIDLHRILCPIDFSDTSRRAMEHAITLAKWYEARLSLLHVVPVLVPLRLPMIFEGTSGLAEPIDADHALFEQQLHEWMEPSVHRAGVQADAIVESGDAARGILTRASTLPADLIVIGSHGHSGVERWILGSVAEKVLRKASCPVMTVPPATTVTSNLPYTRLLCPVDFSDPSLSALRFALSLAKESDANVTILHVLYWPPDEELLAERLDVPLFRETIEEQAYQRLQELITDDVRAWCKPRMRLGYGKPYRQILEVAQADAADLIVMGVHGRNPLDLALFGSTTNQVVRRAPCPVLTVRK